MMDTDRSAWAWSGLLQQLRQIFVLLLARDRGDRM
jgi:hypothetical protein